MAIKTYKKGDYTKIATNFRAREFDCHGSGCCCETKIDDKLVEYLQKIREHFGKPVNITSGCRCATHNAKVGGVHSSLHTKGQATDIVIDCVDPLEIAKYAESIGVKGIGLYEDFVHIDTRTTKSFWYSHNQEYRSTFGGAVAVDSEYAQEQFIRDVQAATGSKVDGIAGPETLRNTVTISASINRTHPVVKPVQKRLAALGYAQVGEADGIAGKKFDMAVKQFQKDHNCWVDGELTAQRQTWQILLKKS